MKKEESLKTFKKFQTLTDRSKDFADELEQILDNIYGKVKDGDYNKITILWSKMYNLYLDLLSMQDDLIDNLK